MKYNFPVSNVRGQKQGGPSHNSANCPFLPLKCASEQKNQPKKKNKCYVLKKQCLVRSLQKLTIWVAQFFC